jgi:hypothetical protein
MSSLYAHTLTRSDAYTLTRSHAHTLTRSHAHTRTHTHAHTPTRLHVRLPTCTVMTDDFVISAAPDPNRVLPCRSCPRAALAWWQSWSLSSHARTRAWSCQRENSWDAGGMKDGCRGGVCLGSSVYCVYTCTILCSSIGNMHGLFIVSMIGTTRPCFVTDSCSINRTSYRSKRFSET